MMELGIMSATEVTATLDVDRDGIIDKDEACERVVGRFQCYG